MNRNNIPMYAKALAAILKKGVLVGEEKTIAENFLPLLQKQGMLSKAPEILDMAEQYWLKSVGKRSIVFETARPMSVAARRKLMQFAQPGDKTTEKVSPDMVAGVRITVNGEQQFDGSLKKKIEQIFSYV